MADPPADTTVTEVRGGSIQAFVVDRAGNVEITPCFHDYNMSSPISRVFDHVRQFDDSLSSQSILSMSCDPLYIAGLEFAATPSFPEHTNNPFEALRWQLKSAFQ